MIHCTYCNSVVFFFCECSLVILVRKTIKSCVKKHWLLFEKIKTCVASKELSSFFPFVYAMRNEFFSGTTWNWHWGMGVRDYSTLRERRGSKVKQSEVKRSLNGNKADAKTRYSWSLLSFCRESVFPEEVSFAQGNLTFLFPSRNHPTSFRVYIECWDKHSIKLRRYTAILPFLLIKFT